MTATAYRPEAISRFPFAGEWMRWLLAALVAIAVAAGPAGMARAEATPDEEAAARAQVEKLNDALLHIMKNGAELGYEGRVAYMQPVVAETYDLATIAARIAGLARFKSYTPEERQAVVNAYERFAVASYARSFKSHSGQTFTVTGTQEAPGKAVLIKTELGRPNDDPVELDYLLSLRDGKAGIADVYFNGVSETARRRSEFAAIQAEGGAVALVSALDEKTAQLAADASAE